ncbi:MAG: SusC/RagA family TonB-linked outer membrane protein [Bacteroidaceae bacterium]
MRITFILLFASVFSLYAGNGYSQDIKVTLSAKNASMTKILEAIESQTDYLFIINSNVNTARKVSVEAKQTAVTKILNDMLKGTDVHYAIEGMYIVLSKNRMNKESAMELADKELIITGKVSDTTGEPLLGVNILLKGTTIGVISDFDGNYSIKVPEGKGELVFSYIGFQQKVVSLNGKSIVNVTMSEDSKVLGEVVVTAMGIERKAKSLTYATQQVQGKELTRAKDANFINALQGKTSGLVITPNSTGAGGSSKLLLRGNSSVLGDNSPLIVLDGVPMADRNGSQIEDALLSGGNGTDGGDGLSNINPDDIASITVLKGANAAALYGSKAGSGVIIITTKQGSEGRVSIDVSSSSLFETPLVLPKFQNDFGGELEYYYDRSINPNSPVYRRRLSAQSWGPRIGTYSKETLNEVPYARNSGMDNVNSFLETGTNFNNSVSVSGGSKLAQSYFSYGNTVAKGMTPGNKFTRHNISFRQSISLFKEHLKLNFSGSYIIQKSLNRPGSGFYANPLYPLYQMPRNADIGYFKDNGEIYGDLYYVNSYDKDNSYRRAGVKGPIQQWPWIDGSDDANNPYWYVNRLKKEARRERIFGSIGATVKVIDGLTAQVRLKIDRTNDSNETKTWQGTKAKNIYNSIYENSRQTNNQIYADFLVSYAKKFGDFDVSANVGGSTQKEDYSSFGVNYWMGDSTSVANVFDPSNIVGSTSARPSTTTGVDQNWENALYATAQLGYKEMAYIDATVRTDWARTFTQFKELNSDNKDYYTYYSVGGNVLLDQMFHFSGDKVSQLKLRLSYSEVGNPIPNQVLNSIRQNYGSGSAVAVQFRSFKKPGPEQNKSTELGIDGSFFNRSLDVDMTFYNTLTVGQWLPLGSATGGQIPLNSGKIRNRGVETTLSYTFSPNHDFNWKTTVNYSYNTNEILKTYGPDGNTMMEREPIFQGGLKVRYEVGKPYGELYGKTFLKDANGKIKVDRMGAPKLTPDYNCYLGNANAPHHLSWGNNFNYKDFSLYFLIDGKIGGTVLSYTEARMDMFGVSKRTGDARNSNITYIKKENLGGTSVGVAVPGLIMEDGNIAPVEEYYKAIGAGEPALSEYAYSATNFRLREISLGYTFRSLFGNGKDLGISLVGRNLFFIYKDTPVDPDVSVSTSNSFGGIEAFSLPTTRSFGINLKASF